MYESPPAAAAAEAAPPPVGGGGGGVDATATVAKPPEPEKADVKLTEYVVLSQSDTDPEGWIEKGKVNARSAQAAVAACVKSLKLEKGVFIAIPSRSFQAITVAVQTETRLTFT